MNLDRLLLHPEVEKLPDTKHERRYARRCGYHSVYLFLNTKDGSSEVSTGVSIYLPNEVFKYSPSELNQAIKDFLTIETLI